MTTKSYLPTEAFPLSWPQRQPRVSSSKRQSARFKVTFGRARDALVDELRLLGAKPNTVIVSSNLPTKRDGLPYSCQKSPDDPAVAVYFLDSKNRPMCIACDRWDSVTGNLQAIRLTVQALRGLNRWGTGQMVEAAFTGFQAIGYSGQAGPAAEAADEVPDETWWQVLQVSEFDGPAIIEASYKRLAWDAHPSRGGSNDAMSRLNDAYHEFQKKLPA